MSRKWVVKETRDRVIICDGCDEEIKDMLELHTIGAYDMHHDCLIAVLDAAVGKYVQAEA